jgi:hypothetical protein
MHLVDMLSGVGVNQEVRAIANLDIEAFAEDIGKVIIGLGKPGPKIAKIESNFHFRFSRAAMRKR